MNICFVIILAYMLFLTPMGFLRDGGTVRHIVCGNYMLEHHTLCTTNFLWYVDQNAPWLSTELLSDFVFAWLYNLAGQNYQYIILASALSTSLALTLAASATRARGCNLFLTIGALILAVVATSLHWSARPHLFSYLLFALVLYLGQKPLSILSRSGLYALIFALWVNLHGSAILGLPIVFIQCLLTFKDKSFKSFCPLVAALVACLLNVRGPGYFAYLWQYTTHEQIFGQGSEWSSFDFIYGIGSYAFIALLVLTIVTHAVKRQTLKQNCPWLALTLVFAVAAFISMRFISYFALLALFSLPPSSIASSDRARSKSWTLITLAASILVSALFINNKIPELNASQMPVKTTDYLKQYPPEGAFSKQAGGFCYDNWGNYIAIKCNRKFFIDDKTDFYPVDFNVVYRACLEAEPGYEQFFKTSKFSYVLIPKACPLAQALRQKSDWRVAAQDNISVLFYPNSTN